MAGPTTSRGRPRRGAGVGVSPGLDRLDPEVASRWAGDERTYPMTMSPDSHPRPAARTTAPRPRARSGVDRWFGDRRVSTKILIVAGVAIAGTVATGGLSLAGIGGLRSTRGEEVGRAVPYITNLNSAALAAKAAANDERGYLIAG